MYRRAVEAPVSFFCKCYNALGKGEESVVFPDANIGPWENARTALAHDHAASASTLSGIEFYAEVFRL